MRRPRRPRRQRGAALLLALVCLSACLSACSSGRAGDALSLTSRCPPVGTPGPVEVDAINGVVADADLPGWQAGDIGASARLSDGRLVWVFGDTVRSPDWSPRVVGNSVLVSAGTCISQLLGDDRGPVIPDVGPDEVRWPMSVVVLPAPSQLRLVGATDLLVVLSARTRRGDSGGHLDFTFRGTSAALFTVTAGGAPQLLSIHEITPDDADPEQVNWGAAATTNGDWLYVYGTRSTGRPLEFGRELYVARAPVAEPTDRARWAFWDGTGWVRDVASAAAVLGAVGGVSQTLSVHQVDDAWLAVSKRDGDLGGFVYTWTAPAPTGPWSPTRALPAPSGVDTGRLTYAPLAHPEIPLASGGLLVSISRNTTDLAELLTDPQVGRPRFAVVPRPAAPPGP